MKVVFSTICYIDHGWSEALDKAAADGWRHVEVVSIPGWIHVDVCQVDAISLSKDVESRGMKLHGIHVGSLHGTNAAAAMYQLPYIKRAVDVLAEAGADQLVFTGGPRESEELEDLLKPLENVLSYMEDTPVMLGLENHYRNRIETLEDFDFLASKIDHPQFGFTADLGHFNSSEVDTEKLLKKHASRIFHVHVKDHLGTQSMPLGQGEVDIPHLISVLKDVGYDRGLSVELEVADRKNLDQYAAEALHYMTNAAKAAGV